MSAARGVERRSSLLTTATTATDILVPTRTTKTRLHVAGSTTTTATSDNTLSEQSESSSKSSSAATPPATATATTAGAASRTLYDVLGASPTDTRAEIKQKYVALVKQCHPDALIHEKIMEQQQPHLPGGGEHVDDDAECATESNLDFNEIATAYAILSNPKKRLRYNRSLQAASVTEHIAATFERQVTQPVATLAVAALENIALPFLARTTATTWSAVSAATSVWQKQSSKQQRVSSSLPKLSKSESSPDAAVAASPIAAANSRSDSATNNVVTDFTKTWETALQAAQSARHSLDAHEWSQQAQVWHQEAVRDYQQAVVLRNRLQRAATRRLTLALHTSQAGLTAAEARLVLSALQPPLPNDESTSSSSGSSKSHDIFGEVGKLDPNLSMEEMAQSLLESENSSSGNDASSMPPSPASNTGLSIWQRLNFLRLSVEREIAVLSQTEADFLAQQAADAAAQDQYEAAVRERLLASAALQRAVANETAARLVYEAAQRTTREQQAVLDEAAHRLSTAEHAATVSSSELERLSAAVSYQSEAVRTALCKKQRAIVKGSGPAAAAVRAVVDSSAADDASVLAEDAQSPWRTILPDTSASDADNAVRLQTLDEWRAQEREMAAEAAALEVTAAKLLSRAHQLQQKVAALPTQSR
jgi:curved DNA-binding protein CbpA